MEVNLSERDGYYEVCLDTDLVLTENQLRKLASLLVSFRAEV